MITRKAIAAAFEVITNDKLVKTVVIFVDTTQMFSRMERVRVTRIGKGQSFAVQFGRLNYAEREYIKSYGRKGKRLPKCWIIPVKKKTR